MNNRLSSESTIRINDDILYNDLQGEIVILSPETGVYFGLDPVGTRAWQLIQHHGRLGAVKDAMLKEYEVSAERLEEDLQELVSSLLDNGLVEVIDESEQVA
jgi:hypothetical protein